MHLVLETTSMQFPWLPSVAIKTYVFILQTQVINCIHKELYVAMKSIPCLHFFPATKTWFLIYTSYASKNGPGNRLRQPLLGKSTLARKTKRKENEGKTRARIAERTRCLVTNPQLFLGATPTSLWYTREPLIDVIASYRQQAWLTRATRDALWFTVTPLELNAIKSQ